MNESAANRILKILEEPPANTIFLLVSEKSAEILPTILSRTQVIGVPPIANEDMKTHLRSDLLLDEEQAKRVAHIAQGCKVKAQSIVEGSELSKANLSFFVELMRSCYSGKDNVPRMVTLCESMQKKSREQVKNMLIYSLRMLRESFVRNLDNTELCYTTKEEETFLEKFCPYVHLDNIFDMSEVFNKAIANIEQNGNVRMVMMDLQLNLAVLFRRPRPNEEIAEVV
jgi:DNA polymerase-3 subunit delta'